MTLSPLILERGNGRLILMGSAYLQSLLGLPCMADRELHKRLEEQPASQPEHARVYA